MEHRFSARPTQHHATATGGTGCNVPHKPRRAWPSFFLDKMERGICRRVAHEPPCYTLTHLLGTRIDAIAAHRDVTQSHSYRNFEHMLTTLEPSETTHLPFECHGAEPRRRGGQRRPFKQKGTIGVTVGRAVLRVLRRSVLSLV